MCSIKTGNKAPSRRMLREEAFEPPTQKSTRVLGVPYPPSHVRDAEMPEEINGLGSDFLPHGQNDSPPVIGDDSNQALQGSVVPPGRDHCDLYTARAARLGEISR